MSWGHLVFRGGVLGAGSCALFHCALLTKSQKSVTGIPESVLVLMSPHLDNEIMKELGTPAICDGLVLCLEQIHFRVM